MKLNILALKPKPGQSVYVYQFPVRLWHWTIVCCIFTRFVTGHFIGQPPQSLRGVPTNLFYFGYLVKTHYIAGLILCIAMLYRIFFAFVGNPVSREIFILPIWRKSWWHGIWETFKWYLFLNKKPSIEMGHNPLAQLAMWAVVIAILFMCLTGLGIYQAKGFSSFFHLFSFMEDLAYYFGGNGFDLVLWHRMGMIIVVAFVWIHVYMVIREEIMGRTTMVSTMINGSRLVRPTPLENLDFTLEDEAKAKANERKG